MHGEVSAREGPSSKGTAGHLAVQGQAGLSLAPAQGANARLEYAQVFLKCIPTSLHLLLSAEALGFQCIFRHFEFFVLKLAQVGLCGKLLIAAHDTSLGGFCRRDLLVRELEEGLGPKIQQPCKLVSFIVPVNSLARLTPGVGG